MATVIVRFRGICCFIDPTKNEKFEKRVVVPNMGMHRHDMEEHLQVIEYLADDLKSAHGFERVSFTRPGDAGQYEYVALTEPVQIEFIGTKPGAVSTPGRAFANSTLHLDELAGKTLQLRSTLLGPAADVDASLAMAVVDLPAGDLVAGPPDSSITTFPPKVNFQPHRVARWLELYTDFEGDFGLRLTPLGDPKAVPKQIWFKSSAALVTIANEPERLIVGHFVEAQPAGESTGHFDIYWDLFTETPFRPIPEPFQGTGPGCVPANKP